MDATQLRINSLFGKFDNPRFRLSMIYQGFGLPEPIWIISVGNYPGKTFSSSQKTIELCLDELESTLNKEESC